MGLFTIFALSSSLLATTQGYVSLTSVSQQDSVPSYRYPSLARNRFRIKSAPYTKLTLVVKPSKNGAGNEITLPVGFIEKSISVSSGDKILRIEEDYIYIPDRNRIRVLNETALKSGQPIRITFERLAVTNPISIPHNTHTTGQSR